MPVLPPVVRTGTSTGIHGGNYADGPRDYVDLVGAGSVLGQLFAQANGRSSTLDQVLAGQVLDPNVGVNTLNEALTSGQIDQAQHDQYVHQLYPDLSSDLGNIATVLGAAMSVLAPAIAPALAGAGAGGALATPAGVGASAAIPAASGSAISSIAPSLLDEIIVHGGTNLLGAGASALGTGASILGGMSNGANPNVDEGITVTGQSPSSGGLSPPTGILGIDQVSRVTPDDFQTRDPIQRGPSPNTQSIDRDLIQKIMNSANGPGRTPVNFGSAGATPAAGPVVGGATPFGGGGAGAGAPSGLAIKGSTAPDIFPWSTGKPRA